MVKVSILGATGIIGKNVAFTLARADTVDEIVMFARQQSIEKVKGEVLDMYDALAAENIDCKLIPTCEFEDIKDSAIVLIAAGIPRTEDMTRLDLAVPNAKIVSHYAEQIAIHAPNSIILVTTNPVDVLTTIAYESSGFDRSKVIGLGNHLDSLRLKAIFSNHFDINSGEIHTRVIGEHGDHMVPLLSSTTIGGIPLKNFMDPSKLYTSSTIQKLKNSGTNIISKKGATEYGPSFAIANLISTIITDSHKILTVSTYLDGEVEGVSGVSLGVPVILSKKGIRMIVPIEMNSVERKEFFEADATVRKATEDVKKIIENIKDKSN